MNDPEVVAVTQTKEPTKSNITEMIISALFEDMVAMKAKADASKSQAGKSLYLKKMRKIQSKLLNYVSNIK